MPPQGKATDRTALGLLGFPASFQEMFQHFCANTTVHGMVRLVCSSHNRMKTSFWALLVTLCLALMCWQFSLVLGRYLERPLLFSIRVSTGELPFPAVTVCTLNPYRPKSVAEDLRALDEAAVENLRFLLGHGTGGQGSATPDPRAPPPGPQLTAWPWLIEHKSHLPPSAAPARPKGAGGLGSDFHSVPLVRNSTWMIGFWLCNASGADCFLQWQSSGVWALREWYSFHYVNILGRQGAEEEPGDPPGGFILDCTFNGIACGQSNYSRFQHPIYGQCYTFNGDSENDRWQSLMPGKGNGLSLLLNTARRDRTPFLSTSAGARVMVHSQDSVPFLEDGGFDIQPGVETSISMRKEEVSRLGGQYGDCTQDGSEVQVTNLYRGAYTQQSCLRSCFQLTMVSRCGCAHYSYPLPSGSEYCDSRRHRGWGHCYFQLYKEYTGDVLGCSQTCRKPCRQTEYTLVAGYGTYPSRKSEVWTFPILEQESRLRTRSGRPSVAKLNIYYRELNFKTTRETPAIPAVVMLSSLGSQWSLWFGSSVLSVIELIELLIDMAALCLILGLGPRLCRPASPIPTPCPEAPPGQVPSSLCSPPASPPASSPPITSCLSLEPPPAGKVNCPTWDVSLEDRGAAP